MSHAGVVHATAVALAESGARVLGGGAETLRSGRLTHPDIEILPLDICAEGAAERIAGGRIDAGFLSVGPRRN